jgi:hypothetical protein
MTQRHLVAVWNPLYTSDVDQHFALLLDWARRADEKKADEEEVYVWWGKVKSPNRQQPLAHRDDIRKLGDALDAPDHRETHLYVTDYRTLYVGRLFDVAEGPLPAEEQGHVPAYYAARDLKCDFWFMVGDFRRLVTDDLPRVAEELRALRNVHYHDKPVSLYGGMVDLPLVVTRSDNVRFFEPDVRDDITGGKLWVQHDAELGGGAAAVERDLRDNVLGETVWNALDWSARSSVAAAEKLFREHRNDPAFDFAPVVMHFSKAIEVQTSAALRAGVAKLPVAARSVNVNGTSRDLANARGMTLGDLVHAMTGSKELVDGVTKAVENGAWFTGQLPAILDALRGVRNPAVHEGRVDRETAARWRNQILGVGSKGHLTDLAAVRARR